MKTEEVVKEVFDLYRTYGDADYIGEPVSQVEHMGQAAQLAEAAGYDDEVILAAFFHDIGHICEMDGQVEKMGLYGVKSHEEIGSKFLREKGFSHKICQLVENHVAAKRYLTFSDESYYNKLSEASKKTLEYQGGRMTADEAAAFKRDPLFEPSIALRHWDEEAKLENQPMPPLSHFEEMAVRHLLKT
ncbi:MULTISPECIES: phosphonate degradation HD-domain oxygenase [unclassified Imperialibacter]|uniref:phosphonate degradation HD-domain oxygenase n=1 Tax=unclassified Imperialibacter TaxID=2629706 RepID=UPI00125A1E36|nr:MULTISPECIES: phosphonate degradation HD-domain oxygenase [unclassified Imperialibacter]CAD5293064.1 2-amino-1-hydroxyethylphosphonate dioxygenase (glycine-forming) [Imperialibacter sp. 89]CAD5294124.1 2-amino-1-hydroxyethylphosphonate dioxygenase (glycine-forming) [Imperialibacter sp. 75]VVT18551.1 Phosphohydrolase [Imperialibacter sp. EC-SDR9]